MTEISEWAKKAAHAVREEWLDNGAEDTITNATARAIEATFARGVAEGMEEAAKIADRLSAQFGRALSKPRLSAIDPERADEQTRLAIRCCNAIAAHIRAAKE